ncbi:MAG: DUF5678 domain-containing protein [Candidatus Omnitrophota bacterium]
MIQTVLDNNKFNGRYIAMKSFADHSVIGDGATPEEAYIKATKSGCQNPVITFVPVKGMVQIY